MQGRVHIRNACSNCGDAIDKSGNAFVKQTEFLALKSKHDMEIQALNHKLENGLLGVTLKFEKALSKQSSNALEALDAVKEQVISSVLTVKNELASISKDFEIHKISVKEGLTDAQITWIKRTIFILGFYFAATKLDPSQTKGSTPEPSGKFEE